MKDIIILAIAILVIIAIILKNMYSQLDEKTYIINSYLYIFGSLLFVVLCANIYDKNDMMTTMTDKKLFAVFVLTLMALFGIMLTPRKNQISKHLFLLLFLIGISVSTFITYKIADEAGILYKVLIALGIIVLTLSVIAYSQPLDIFDTWQPFLLTGLISLIVVQLLDIIFVDGISSARDNIYGWLTILLFSGFLLYDTNKLRQDAEIMVQYCRNKSQFVCTDYPTQSLSLFLDILNMFSGLVRSQR